MHVCRYGCVHRCLHIQTDHFIVQLSTGLLQRQLPLFCLHDNAIVFLLHAVNINIKVRVRGKESVCVCVHARACVYRTRLLRSFITSCSRAAAACSSTSIVFSRSLMVSSSLAVSAAVASLSFLASAICST